MECCLGMAYLGIRAYSFHCLEGGCEDAVTGLFLEFNEVETSWRPV